MNSLTTSNHLNLRTVYQFDPHPSERTGRSKVRPGVVQKGKRLAARGDYPSAAEIEQMTRQIILAILAASRGAAPENPAD